MAYTPGQPYPGMGPPSQPQTFDENLLRTLPQGSNPNALTIDQVNIAMRNSPVWNSWMQQRGINTQNVHLSDSDKNGLAKTLELAGFPLPEGWEIDDAGNIREETHIGRNILIAAAIAGAAFGGYALLAAYGPEAGVTAAASEAGGGGAYLGGEVAVTSLGSTVPIGTTVGGTAASASLGSGLTVGAAGTTASTASQIYNAAKTGQRIYSAANKVRNMANSDNTSNDGQALDDAGNPIGSPTDNIDVQSLAGNYIDPDTGDFMIDPSNLSEPEQSTLSKISQAIKGGSTWANALRAAGVGISNATQAAGQNRLNQENLGVQVNRQNIEGQTAFETELLNRAKLEDTQRNEAQRNLYKASYAQNPRVSPFDPTGGPKYSADYLAAMDALSGQGRGELTQSPVYGARSLPTLPPYTPINIKDVQGATGQNPSTLERVGQILGPSLTTVGNMGGGGNSNAPSTMSRIGQTASTAKSIYDLGGDFGWW